MVRNLSSLLFLLLFFVQAANARLPDFTSLIEDASPAVVKIHTVQKVGGNRGQQHLPDHVPDIFREFFERRQMPERDARSMGSGVIISRDGYVLTNNHVVGEADEISVRLIDRREYDAEVVGTDPRSDLALLKIDAGDLPVARFAQADSLKVGEWVVAIGSPFGLDYSATAGIVSAIGRSIPSDQGQNYVPFIQSDVAINPGHSGGPLLNMDGEVVGINSQIYTRSGGSIGLSFAIPVSLAQEVVKQLREKGRVDRGWLGVYIQEVDRDLARSLGLDKPRGALIAQVQAGSPADKAGLRPGDVIVEFNGEAIRESGDLPHRVGLITPGDKAKALIVRDKRRQTLTVEVGALPGEDDGRDRSAPQQEGGDRLGLQTDDIGPEVKSELGIEGGVGITRVFPDTPAQRAQLRRGDIIVQLGNHAIEDLRDYRRAREDIPEGVPVMVRFMRDGQFFYRTIQVK